MQSTAMLLVFLLDKKIKGIVLIKHLKNFNSYEKNLYNNSYDSSAYYLETLFSLPGNFFI